MIALIIIGIALVFISLTLPIIYSERDDLIGIWFMLMYLGLMITVFSVKSYSYKQGQEDYSKGNIKYEQVIETDTLFVKIK